MAIGMRMRSRRLNLALTQESLASRCGSKQADISRWERGEEPSASRVPAIADALGVSVRWLLTGEDTGPSEAA